LLTGRYDELVIRIKGRSDDQRSNGTAAMLDAAPENRPTAFQQFSQSGDNWCWGKAAGQESPNSGPLRKGVRQSDEVVLA
jgi:hypothetical protein